MSLPLSCVWANISLSRAVSFYDSSPAFFCVLVCFCLCCVFLHSGFFIATCVGFFRSPLLASIESTLGIDSTLLSSSPEALLLRATVLLFLASALPITAWIMGNALSLSFFSFVHLEFSTAYLLEMDLCSGFTIVPLPYFCPHLPTSLSSSWFAHAAALWYLFNGLWLIFGLSDFGSFLWYHFLLPISSPLARLFQVFVGRFLSPILLRVKHSLSFSLTFSHICSLFPFLNRSSSTTPSVSLDTLRKKWKARSSTAPSSWI